jgi:hypothetical protein
MDAAKDIDKEMLTIWAGSNPADVMHICLL